MGQHTPTIPPTATVLQGNTHTRSASPFSASLRVESLLKGDWVAFVPLGSVPVPLPTTSLLLALSHWLLSFLMREILRDFSWTTGARQLSLNHLTGNGDPFSKQSPV